MSEQQFNLKLAAIEDQANAMQERVDAYRDQQLARLFVDSGWSQEKLAEHLEGRWGRAVSQPSVCCRLRFGRFLNFFITDCNKGGHIPLDLTEGKFRSLWEKTKSSDDFRGHRANTEAAKQDELRRFAEVYGELRSPRPKKAIKKAIAEELGNKPAWLTCEEIAEKIAPRFGDEPRKEIDAKDVRERLRHWKPSPKAPFRVEKASKGSEARYRLVRVKGKIATGKQLAEWASELISLMEQLIDEAKKDRVLISQPTLTTLASKIQRVLESLVARVNDETECQEV